MSIPLFHKIIYSFKEVVVNKGEVLLKEGDPVNFLIIVKTGEIELSSHIDSTTFVLEKLGPGSILNFRKFYFDDETNNVNVTCP